MTELLNITRTNAGGLEVTMETGDLPQPQLRLTVQFPPGQALMHMPLLELQADLMAQAVAELERRIQVARRLLGQPPIPPSGP